MDLAYFRAVCALFVCVCNESTVVTCLFEGLRNEDNYTLRRRMSHLFLCCLDADSCSVRVKKLNKSDGRIVRLLTNIQ